MVNTARLNSRSGAKSECANRAGIWFVESKDEDKDREGGVYWLKIRRPHELEVGLK
jgi:hypothetical protein